MRLHFLLDAVFQANPGYTLVEWGNLNQPERDALAGSLNIDAEVFGVFKPVLPGEKLGVKLAYKEVALLFYFLQKTSALPNYLKLSYNDELNKMLARLIMEDVLQIESNDSFVSGIEAYKVLYEDIGAQARSSKYIEALSAKAVEYVLQLNYLDLSTAISRLYAYNTIPPPLKEPAHIATDEAKTFSLIDYSPHLQKKLLKNWDRHLPTKEFPWLTYTRSRNGYQRNKNVITYKMYVSPMPEYFMEVYEKTATLLSATKAFTFKSGIDQTGLLRPDKFVVYFHKYEDVIQAAALLSHELNSYPAQGVPFTAQLDETGLLSWGIDPPQNNKATAETGSWRAHIAERLAVAALQAKESGLDKKEAYSYILNKIYLEKIDPHTWIPQENFWN